MVDLVPDKSGIFGVKVFDFLHDSPRHSHVAMINFVPDPRVKLHVTRPRRQHIAVMMAHLRPALKGKGTRSWDIALERMR